MAKLLETEYADIFSPETLQTLRGKSGESLRQLLGNKTLTQAMMSSQQFLNQIAAAEAPHKEELSRLAVQMVMDAYPIIHYANIKIDAKIGGEAQVAPVQQDEEPPEQQEPEIPGGPEVPEGPVPEDLKRRIINGITHGAAIRGAFGYLLFRENLDRVNPELVNNYGEILKLTFGVYDSDEAIALMLSMLAQNQKIEGGNTSASYSEGGEGEGEEEPGFIIKANAINFPFLIHEIVKGLYEILSLQGFSEDPEDKAYNNAIVQRVDKLDHEPEDLRFGKFVYDALVEPYLQSDYDDTRVRDLYLTHIYKLPTNQFMSFVDNAIHNRLTRQQLTWANDTLRTVSDTVRRDELPDDF